MDFQERETRRADNQIWNGAGTYGYSNRFHSFDREDQASLYMNTVMGLTRRYYDYEKLETFLLQLETYPHSELYTEVFWLCMERCAWLHDQEDRPVLTDLRRDYAASQLALVTKKPADKSLESLKYGWFRRAVDLPREESPWETQVLDAMEFSPDWQADQVIGGMKLLLSKYLKRTFRDKLDFMNSNRVDLGFFSKLGNRHHATRQLGISTPGAPGAPRQKGLLGFGKPQAEKVRDYIESCFGTSLLPMTDQLKLEEKLCTDCHKNCYLHITDGTFREDAAPTRERSMFQVQAEKNREYYRKSEAQNRIAIQQLTQRLRNTLLLREDDCGARFRSGELIGHLAWRAVALEDSQLFRRNQNEDPDELIVDVVLDASASQNKKQEQLAAQAYILAEALTRCQIPVRVLSYCSVSGCTVMRIFRDYYENSKNERIFEFASAGWNRDGLAIRALDWLVDRSGDAHRLILILSDANPNDDQKLAVPHSLPRDYSGKPAVEETAKEAAQLRKGARTVLCIFSGLDKDLDNCREIYGRDYIRLPSAGWFAETVGTVIQKKLQILQQ